MKRNIPTTKLYSHKKSYQIDSFFYCKSDYKPGYVIDDHLSRSNVTIRLKRPTRDRRATLCLMFGLASNGVYICPACYHPGGSLLHCLSTLTTKVAVYFCCTFLGVPSTRHYLASCSMKPGLSSPATFRLCSRDHPSNLQNRTISFTQYFVKFINQSIHHQQTLLPTNLSVFFLLRFLKNNLKI